MSESTHVHIGQVHQCWIEVDEHIRVTTREVGTWQPKPEATARLLPAFSAPHQKQNVPIYLVAYFLDPFSIQSEQIPASEQNEIIIAPLVFVAGLWGPEKRWPPAQLPAPPC